MGKSRWYNDWGGIIFKFVAVNSGAGQAAGKVIYLPCAAGGLRHARFHDRMTADDPFTTSPIAALRREGMRIQVPAHASQISCTL